MLVTADSHSERIKIRRTAVINETPNIPDECGIQTRANQTAIGQMLLEHQNVIMLPVWRLRIRACSALFTGSSDCIVQTYSLPCVFAYKFPPFNIFQRKYTCLHDVI
jgi:hypothetical protein